MKSGLGSRSRSRSRLEKRAEAAKKLAGSPGLLEDNKHKEIVLLLVFFRYNSTRKLYGKKKQLFYYLYYLQFYLTILRGTEYFAKLNQ